MAIKPCCQKPENLVRKRLKPDLVVDVCKVCGAKHYTLKADAGKLGAELKPLGNR